MSTEAFTNHYLPQQINMLILRKLQEITPPVLAANALTGPTTVNNSNSNNHRGRQHVKSEPVIKKQKRRLLN